MNPLFMGDADLRKAVAEQQQKVAGYTTGLAGVLLSALYTGV